LFGCVLCFVGVWCGGVFGVGVCVCVLCVCVWYGLICVWCLGVVS